MDLTQQQGLDWIIKAQKWNRIKSCENSLREFAFTYFRHYFYVEPSIMHDELFDTIQGAVDSGKSHKIARAAPRGNAKSTLVSFVTVMWCALYGKKHYILLISDTSSQADAFLMSIKTELEENTLINHDFGNFYGEVWNTSDIVLSNDVRIQALGTGKRVRGRRYKQYRPDLIICDDIENDENLASPDQRKKNSDWYFKALSKAGDERTDIIVIGTIIHYDSLLANVLKNPIYDSKIYRAVIRFSTSDKWEAWEHIITELSNPNRLTDARNFFELNKEEMLRDTQVLWEAKEDYYDLMVQRVADGPAAFSSEKQNEPLADDDRYFLPQWIHYYEDKDLLGVDLYVVGFVDPSMGKQGGDFSAIITIGEDSNGYIYVLKADLKRRHPDIIINDALLTHDFFHYRVLGVETNQFQEYFKDSMEKKIRELQELDKKFVNLKIKEVRQNSDKVLRIQSLQPDIKSGRIKFKRDQQMLIEQLVNFPSASHDDGPDALEGAIQLLGKRSAFADYLKERAHELKKPNIESYLQNPNLQRIN